MSETDTAANPYQTHKLFSPGRVWALAMNTFTQLVRMRVFYFLLIFSVIIIASSFLLLRFTFEEELKILKDVSFGSMSLFASIFAMVGTALLIPKDVEDRTLYTILSKPVPRMEYLMGKLLGVIVLLAVSLGIMALLFFAVLYFRQQIIISEQVADLTRRSIPEDQIEAIRQTIKAQGLSVNLLNGVLAIFLKASVAAAMALAVSTLASSTLFTIIVSLVVYFIGHVQAVARDYWLQANEITGFAKESITAFVAIVFPDFQGFNVIDGIVAGEIVPFGVMFRIVGLSAFYLAIYNLIAYLIFARKEL